VDTSHAAIRIVAAMEGPDYCVVCQAGHRMAASCFQCKVCGQRGHLAKDCSGDILEMDDSEENPDSEVVVLEETTSVQATPVKTASVQAASVQAASVQAASVQAASVQAASVEAASVEAASVEAASVMDQEHKKAPKTSKNITSTTWNKLASEGVYKTVFCHCESLRSSFSPILHLTQLAAVVDQGETFFRAMVPPGLEDYLDHCKIGGDLLTHLNMAREDQGTFLFRSPVLVKRTERVECVTESEAMEHFLAFLEATGGNTILVCVDEDTAGVLMEKLKKVDKGRFRGVVVGYSWWRRVLKHIKFPKYKTVELEDYSATNLPPTSTKTKMTSKHVAQMLKDAARKVAGVQAGPCGRQWHAGSPVGGQFLSLVSVSSKLKALTTPRPVNTGPETLELINSLRPDLPATLTVERLEQVELESDHEGGEYMEVEMKPQPVEPNYETVEISDSDSDSVTELDKEDPGPCWMLDKREGYSRIICPVCLRPLSITSPAVMERHLSLHRDSDLSVTMRWQCGVCKPTQMFIDAINIGQHMEVVHNAKVLVSVEPVWRDIGLPTASCLLTKPPATTSASQVKGWRMGKVPKNWCSSVICPECGEDVLAKDVQRHMERHIGISKELPCLMCQDDPLKTLATLKMVSTSDIGKHMVDFHIKWQPKGEWNEILSAPRNEPLSRYWRCMQRGNNFSVICPGGLVGCVSWVKLETLPNHLWINHGASLHKLLAGRGCAECNITVPLASLPLHLDCMSQKPPAELPNPANSPANLQKPANAPSTPKPGGESPTQYWTCKPSGTKFLIECPAKGCISWVGTKKLSVHLKKVHGKSGEQSLAGRGCYRCDKIVPVASLPLHVRCMNQRPPAKLPKPAQSQAKQQDTSNSFKIISLPPTLPPPAMQGEEIQMQAALLSECKASTSTGAPAPSPGSSRGPGSRQAGESSEESPRKRLKTGEDSVTELDKVESGPCWRLDKQKGWTEGRQFFCRITCPVCSKWVSMTCPSDMECHMLVHSTRRRTVNKSWQCGVCKHGSVEALIDASNVGFHMIAFHDANLKVLVHVDNTISLEPLRRDAGLSMDTMEDNVAYYLEHMNGQARLPAPVPSLPSRSTATNFTANPVLGRQGLESRISSSSTCSTSTKLPPAPVPTPTDLRRHQASPWTPWTPWTPGSRQERQARKGQ